MNNALKKCTAFCLSFNPLAPVLTQFVNASFTSHYGYSLSASTFAWLWSSGTVCFNLGAVLASVFCMKWFLENWGRRNSIMIWSQVSNQLNQSISQLHLQSCFFFQKLPHASASGSRCGSGMSECGNFQSSRFMTII